MRKLFTISSLFFFCATALAQAPQGINYQGVARGLDGQPIAQTDISVRISVLKGSANGEIEYEEVHEIRTNAFGLFTLVIGKGEPTTGSFNFIGWTEGNKWLQIELDENGGRNFKLMGSQQLMSVPYALYAERAGNGYQAGNGISIANNMITNTGDGDNNATNELITAIELAGSNLRITDAGGTKQVDLSTLGGAAQNLNSVLAQGNSAGNQTITNLATPLSASDAANKSYVDNLDAADGDKSPTNEIQTLTKTGSTVSLTSGGSFDLNDDNPTNEIQNLTGVLSQGNDAGGSKITNLGTPSINSDATTKLYVDNLDAADGDKSATNEIQNLSSVLTQSNNAGGAKITNLGAPSVNSDAATKLYVDNLDAADSDKSATNEIQNLTSVLGQGNNAGGTKITNLGAPTINSDAATKLYVDNLDAADDDKSATNEIQNLTDVLSQGNDAGGTKITNLGTPTVNSDATTKLYVDNLDAADGDKSSTNEIQNLASVLTTGTSGGGNRITNIADPTATQDAATKNYVDAADAVLSSRISNTYAFKTNFSYTNLTGIIESNITLPFTTEDFDDFNVLASNSFTASEAGTYYFVVEGSYSALTGQISLLYNSIKFPIVIVSPIGLPSLRFSGSFMFKLNAGETISLIGDSIALGGTFDGRFYGFKL